MLDRHDRVAQQHALLVRRHDLAEFDVLTLREAWAFAAVADRLRDAVGTAVHLHQHGGKERRALGAQLVALRAVLLVTVDAERLLDVRLFLWNIVLDFRLLLLGQESGKNAHI